MVAILDSSLGDDVATVEVSGKPGQAHWISWGVQRGGHGMREVAIVNPLPAGRHEPRRGTGAGGALRAGIAMDPSPAAVASPPAEGISALDSRA
jgi:hypothetical protein